MALGKGLNSQEVSELIKYIQENNSWENMYKILHGDNPRNRRIIKYYEMVFDTRDGMMWKIIFSNIINGNPKECDKDGEVIFRTEAGYDLKQKIYDWLDGKQ